MQVEEGGGFAGLKLQLGLIVVSVVAHLQRQLAKGIVCSVAQRDGVAAGRFADDGARRRQPSFLKAAPVALALLLELQRHQLT